MNNDNNNITEIRTEIDFLPTGIRKQETTLLATNQSVY